MNILSVECSAFPVSAAISQNGKIIASDFSVKKVTHSETLIPMIKSVLEKAELTVSDIDYFAVAAGPGSFTGIRIGISAVKGLAAPEHKKCIGVSTLFAMAHCHTSFEGIVCAVMDARCNQVYNALFEISGGIVKRLTDDRAISCTDLANELKTIDCSVLICGDGINVFMPFVKELNNVTAASGDSAYQNAVGVDACAQKCLCDAVLPDELLPIYLRLPQAERELKEKRNL